MDTYTFLASILFGVVVALNIGMLWALRHQTLQFDRRLTEYICDVVDAYLLLLFDELRKYENGEGEPDEDSDYDVALSLRLGEDEEAPEPPDNEEPK